MLTVKQTWSWKPRHYVPEEEEKLAMPTLFLKCLETLWSCEVRLCRRLGAPLWLATVAYLPLDGLGGETYENTNKNELKAILDI